MILKGAWACRESGISELHAEVFQSVANATNCVNMCRAVGKYATGLIAEGYSSKGYHNKAKSCNWGPMAGFVLADPRFTKSPDGAEQKKLLTAALTGGASTVDLYISDARRIWLAREHLYTVVSATSDEQIVLAHHGALSIYFVLQRDKAPGPTRGLWKVMYFDRSERQETSPEPTVTTSRVLMPTDSRSRPSAAKAAQSARESARASANLNDVPKPKPEVAERMTQEQRLPVSVLAIRDPHCTVPSSDYRSATTGDYDLFAIWPNSAMNAPEDGDDQDPAEQLDYDARNLDMRMIPTHKLEKRIKANKSNTFEHEHRGNLTPRIAEISLLLNAGFVLAGYTGGNMVHHSDEGGRPFVKSIDLPVFAVVPHEKHPYSISSVEAMQVFVRKCRANYRIHVNKGWCAELGIPVGGANVN